MTKAAAQRKALPVGLAQMDYAGMYQGGSDKPPPGSDPVIDYFKPGRKRLLKVANADLMGLVRAGPVDEHGIREFDPFTQEFRFKLIRPDSHDTWIDRYVTSVSWTEDQGQLIGETRYPVTGKLAISNADISSRGPQGQRVWAGGKMRSTDRLVIHAGHDLECWARWPNSGRPDVPDQKDPNAGFVKLWRMHITKCNGVDIASDSAEYDLIDEMGIWQLSQDDFHFGVNARSHARGWRAHDVAIAVARQYGIPLGEIARGRNYVITSSTTFIDASPLNPIAWAYAQEGKKTGELFVFRLIEGRLCIYRARRNPFLFRFRDLITSSTIGWDMSAYFTSASARVHIRAKGQKGKDKSAALSVSYHDPRLVRQFGLVHHKLDIQATSRQDATDQIKRAMAKSVRRIPSAEFTTLGICLVHAGDAIEIDVPEEGFGAWRYPLRGLQAARSSRALGSGYGTAIAFVSAVTHTVDAGSGYMMDVSTTYLDPFNTPGAGGEKTIANAIDSAVRVTKSYARQVARSHVHH